MDFRLTDEQQMLSETVSDLFGDLCTGTDLHRLFASGEARDGARWERIVAMGLPGLMAPEASGGSALGPVEMALVAVAAGHAALPEPLVEHAGIAVPLLAQAGAAGLEHAAKGETIAVGHPSMPLVADADTAFALLLADGGELHCVPREAVRIDRVESLDPFRRLFRVEWAPQTASRVGGEALIERMLDLGALFAAAQLLGLAQRAIDLAVAYARERHQFGKPIGSFQAVKHHLASAQVKIEFARPVLLAAAAMLAEESSLASVRISHAKLAATAAADAASHTAVQIHGAMGYSWEVDVHFVLKRALALGQAWGTAAFHRARVAEHVLRQPLGPDRTFGQPFTEEAVLEPA
jgi:alkylation response protein AidB-like acyl-CoA dehydrogenase